MTGATPNKMNGLEKPQGPKACGKWNRQKPDLMLLIQNCKRQQGKQGWFAEHQNFKSSSSRAIIAAGKPFGRPNSSSALAGLSNAHRYGGRRQRWPGSCGRQSRTSCTSAQCRPTRCGVQSSLQRCIKQATHSSVCT